MRTTLTIDDDVAFQLEQLRRRRNAKFKVLVNEALRRGLRDMSAPAPKKRRPFRTRTFNAGPSLIGDIDNTAEVLAIVEGEAYK